LRDGYAHDIRNRLIAIPGEKLSYDVIGRRLTKGSTSHLYLGDEEIGSYENGCSKELQVPGLGRAAAIEYVFNNPFAYRDPDGQFAFVILFLIWGAEFIFPTLSACICPIIYGAVTGAVVYGGYQLTQALNENTVPRTYIPSTPVLSDFLYQSNYSYDYTLWNKKENERHSSDEPESPPIRGDQIVGDGSTGVTSAINTVGKLLIQAGGARLGHTIAQTENDAYIDLRCTSMIDSLPCFGYAVGSLFGIALIGAAAWFTFKIMKESASK